MDPEADGTETYAQRGMEGRMVGVGELASSAVVLLATKAVEAVGGEAGKRLIGDLWDRVKAKLAGRDALADFEASPDDGDAQAALRLQLKKALETDPAFRAEIEKLLGTLPEKDREAIRQRATASEGSKVAQIAGKGNVVKQ